MKIQYSDRFVQNFGMGDPTTCVYQFIYYKNDNYDRKIIKYFIRHGLGLWIKEYSFLSHMFYAC